MIRNSVLKYWLVFSLAFTLSGCVTTPVKRYTEVPFCWNTNHRLAPAERFLIVSIEPDNVLKILLDWSDSQKGRLVEKPEKIDFCFILSNQSLIEFQETQVQIKTLWVSFDNNQALNASFSDKTLKDIEINTKKQIKKFTLSNSGFKMVIGVDRNAEQVTSKLIEARRYSSIYEQGIKKSDLESVLTFWVNKTDDMTTVYAVGTPRIGDTLAGPGKSIGIELWPYGDARAESWLVQNAFEYIKSIETSSK